MTPTPTLLLLLLSSNESISTPTMTNVGEVKQMKLQGPLESRSNIFGQTSVHVRAQIQRGYDPQVCIAATFLQQCNCDLQFALHLVKKQHLQYGAVFYTRALCSFGKKPLCFSCHR
ncbi:hypothetical protein F2P81_020796 [Scophthalmus maximus]|uniref:Uncharacterized protein n=1 Tax=Scophthalmus maximus TaxID=52904 RepID=A0A6A4S0K7_SCOMX|nr:hypothetical protein F2P81_020796 [Scophthalmus maximus]